jgi:hypothetical protein
MEWKEKGPYRNHLVWVLKLIAVSSLLFLTTAAIAEGDPFKALISAKSLKCQFGPGSVGRWSGAKASVSHDNWDSTLHLDSIDAKAGKARVIGNAGASDVAVLVSGSGITFVEETGFGNFVFITVFAVFSVGGPGPDELYAVMSRHMNLPGGPLPSQYHGKCRVW